MGVHLQTTAAGSAIAAAMVVAGAPLFSAGLHSLRMRRRLRRLETLALDGTAIGFGLARGRVALESPLVGPLSGQPCAGYRLEVLGPGGLRLATRDDFRAFRLASRGASAHVASGEGVWDLSAVAERDLAPAGTPSENLRALLARSPEATWLRRCGLTVTLVERALLANDECFVIGSMRAAEPYELAHETELLRTGTDGRSVPSPARAGAPRRWIESDPALDFLRISDRAPSRSALAVPAWRTLGVVVGPILSLAGLLYLAALADALRALAGFPR